MKLSTLVCIRHRDGRQLLLLRTRPPNVGLWSPIGGKVDMTSGESPLQCALREVHEEVGLALQPQQLHLWALVTEKNYCGHGHWLLFIYEAQVELEALPPAIDEGHFGFFPLADIAAGQVPIPPSDGQLLWGLYPQWRRGLVVLRAVWPEPCGEPAAMHVTLEASYPPSC